jgi:hypothetical protein
MLAMHTTIYKVYVLSKHTYFLSVSKALYVAKFMSTHHRTISYKTTTNNTESDVTGYVASQNELEVYYELTYVCSRFLTPMDSATPTAKQF